MYEREPKSAREVLSYAAHARLRGATPTYIICGKNGPTGKTWLCDELKRLGHNAIEVSGGLNDLVDYRDNENHLRNDGFGLVLIVLNKPLDYRWKL